MKLAEAIVFADRAMAKAEEMDATISVAVLDDVGQLVQLDRMDGASLMSPDLAEAKAATALNFRKPTSALATLRPEALKTITDAVFFKVLAVPGGLPIVEGGRILGAIGVSGDESVNDELIARHALGEA
jgi:glc operon protein GlcG